MATAETGDGARIHYDVYGDGPDVVAVNYWNCHPSAFDALRSELSGDYRFITYDDRGSGASTRTGPYDLDTAADDLLAVLEAAEARDAVAVGTSDSVLRAGPVALRRPELIDSIITFGGAPLDFDKLSDADALIGSQTVVDTFIHQIQHDYRGALRSIISAVNDQMSEDEIRQRVGAQVEYTPQDASLERIQAWRHERRATDIGRELGERIWLLTGEGAGGAWFPPVEELEALIAEFLPKATVRRVEGGMMSRPDEVAVALRDLRSERQLTSPQSSNA